MIQPNELRIGNLAIVSSTIKKVDGMGITWAETHPNYYEPIQISEDWLLKLGFDRFSYDCFEMPFKGKKLSYFIHDKDVCIEFEINDLSNLLTIADDIKYVHQLQNLLFSLTGKELTYTPSAHAVT